MPNDDDIKAARDGLEECNEKMSSGEYDLVVLTGRYASEELIDIADLVTDMVEIKHYHSQGVLSREGYDC